MATRAKTSKAKSAVKRPARPVPARGKAKKAVSKVAAKIRATVKSALKGAAKGKAKVKAAANRAKPPKSTAAKGSSKPKAAAASPRTSDAPRTVDKPWQNPGASQLTVEQYVATKVPPPWRSVMAELRMVVKTACPEAEECIKWGQPVFECDGPFAWMKAHGKYVNFGFWRGAELTDPDGILEGEGDRMRHVKIRDPEQVPAGKIDALIREAVALNREKGSPVLRRS